MLYKTRSGILRRGCVTRISKDNVKINSVLFSKWYCCSAKKGGGVYTPYSLDNCSFRKSNCPKMLALTSFKSSSNDFLTGRPVAEISGNSHAESVARERIKPGYVEEV